MHATGALLEDTRTTHFESGEPVLLRRGDIGTVVMLYEGGVCARSSSPIAVGAPMLCCHSRPTGCWCSATRPSASAGSPPIPAAVPEYPALPSPIPPAHPHREPFDELSVSSASRPSSMLSRPSGRQTVSDHAI